MKALVIPLLLIFISGCGQPPNQDLSCPTFGMSEGQAGDTYQCKIRAWGPPDCWKVQNDTNNTW